MSASPWPKYRHDAHNTIQSPYKGPQTNHLKWKIKTWGYVSSSPAIDRWGNIYFVSGDKYVYAINPKGKLKWRYKTGYPVYSSPAIGSDGTLYIGGMDYYMYAIK